VGSCSCPSVESLGGAQREIFRQFLPSLPSSFLCMARDHDDLDDEDDKGRMNKWWNNLT